MKLIGVDPGAKTVGVCTYDLTDPNGSYIERGEDEALHAFLNRSVASVVGWVNSYDEQVLVGVEDMNPPKSHMNGKKQFVKPAFLIDTGKSIGALWTGIATQTDALLCMVPPGKHGKQPLWSYPPGLVGKRETTGTGKAPMQHVRAAYDIAAASAFAHAVATK